MRTVFLSQTQKESNASSLSSGPGAPIFQPGPQTRIYRTPVRAIAAAELGDGREIYGQVVDVSLGGCLFKTAATMELGDPLELRITLLGDDRRSIAEVSGVVRRVTEVEGRRAYGIELVGRTREERRTLEWLYTQALR